MKKGIVLALLAVSVLLLVRSKKPTVPHPVVFQPAIKPTTAHSLPQEGVFIPYWAQNVAGNGNGYDAYYYFGIRPRKDGTLEDEPGLQNAQKMDIFPEKKKKIVLRMLENPVSDVLLTEKASQKTLIAELGDFMEDNSFSGVVLDLEIPFTLNAKKKSQINDFVQLICNSVHSYYKTCSILMYGDTFYRNRPYDVAKLGTLTDSVLVMAYDFHKAGGEAGPNFSFEDEKTYGYDFKRMVSDFKSAVPADKLEVVFGMYGYDWTLNDKGTPLKAAEALSLSSIRAKVARGSLSAMVEKRNPVSKEKNVEYKDGEGRNHSLWFEDEESVTVKKEFLRGQGISRTSFWAYGYF